MLSNASLIASKSVSSPLLLCSKVFDKNEEKSSSISSPFLKLSGFCSIQIIIRSFINVLVSST